jgi:predicted membrane protein
MDVLALPIVQPVFRIVRNTGRLMHLTAAGLILAYAFNHFIRPFPSEIFFWSQLILALDILFLVFAGRHILTDYPWVNQLFRLIEALFFLGIALLMFMTGKYVFMIIYILLGALYLYLLYCERKVTKTERIALHHTGITISSLPEDKFFYWSQIVDLKATYDSIMVITGWKTYHFNLQKNLAFEELEQIHEFCRHYLGKTTG